MDREKSYRELFLRSPDAILIMEGDRFVDCNPAAVEMLGFPSKQALFDYFSHPADISPPRQPDGRDSYEKAEEYLAITFERGTHTFEWMHVRADGEEFLVEVQLTVVRRGDKPLLHVSWRDISERKRLEGELRRAQRLEAVGRLAGGVAHDFNNLLVVILSHAELLRDELAAGRPEPEHIDEIMSASDRAAELTRQLLAFSRGQPAQLRPTDLNDLVQGLSSLLRRLIGEHIELVLDQGPDEPLTVVADASQLEQIVVNLAANARDAMPNGGRLEISVGRRQIVVGQVAGPLGPGNYVALRVSDNGSGMTPEQLDCAFDPFYTTKSLGKGTGLGLATVYAVAEQNGGYATIESAPDEGTTVEVLLPLSRQEPVVLGSEPVQVSPFGAGETILLVEDETAIRDLFAQSLKTAGYRVIPAVDGQDALDRAAELDTRIDLLVTDVVMPRLSGPGLVEQMLPGWPGLRVLYMSGYSTETNLSVMAHDERANVLQKPFSSRVLLAEVRRSLDQRLVG